MAYAQPDGSTPRPREEHKKPLSNTEGYNDHAKTLQHKADNPAPTTVNIHTYRKQEQADGQINKGKSEAVSDSWIEVFTGILALVGILQAWILYRQTVHFRRTERPYIFITVELKGNLPGMLSVEGIEDMGVNFDVGVHIKNHGKTPAILKSVTYLVKPTGIPPNVFPKPHPIETKLPEGLVIGSGAEDDSLNIHSRITAKEWLDIRENRFFYLVCYVLVRYKDTVSNRTRETSLLWHYYPVDKRLSLSNNHKLNYYR
jgi:hypothetical protein